MCAAEKVESSWVKSYYEDPEVVDHYRRATANIGLWQSEEVLFRRVFDQKDRILELGTGTGRIAIGLAELGFEHLLGIEISKGMVKEARRISTVLELSVAFQQGDATHLKFEDELFDGAIFGFNGLMQIPGREARQKALAEIFRVIRPGGAFVFTTHDRHNPRFKKFWRQEQDRWNKGKQKPELLEFGDRWEETELGKLYIHVPTPEEVRKALQEAGWKCEWDSLRSSIAKEPIGTREFSDECRFWVARKPL
ncbi:methyltransferase domain-containing protein [Puniceicoccales bacterium CK1056]|uniref:Methyltransferase domain-containing protein n=1 Tax=Oceanipulchritudo coccoides TaxID=2706888 RepID=A0A6B2M7B9_9BACT|nr:methyltransferase domain-containing protein [Oceanipulchritudo coccoides]NDV63520.1 methyltransferase domain-containing protein [Oceanipulchritudo coccoides]